MSYQIHGNLVESGVIVSVQQHARVNRAGADFMKLSLSKKYLLSKFKNYTA
jgi:hypothetical protein